MRVLKYAAIALGGLVVLIVLGVVWLLATLDTERIKAELARAVQENTERTLRIDGEADISLWPGLGVELGRLSLSEHRSETPFVSLDSARVSVEILPLISKRIVIDAIELVGADVTIVRRKDGSTNVDDLLAGEEQESSGMRFDVGEVRLTDSRLAYRDEATGQEVVLSELDFRTGRLGEVAEGELELATRLQVAQPKSIGEVRVSGGYRYDVGAGSFGLDDLEATLKGDVAGLQGLEASVTAERLGFERASKAIDVQHVNATARGRRDAESLDVKIEAPRLAVSEDRAGGESVRLAARLSGAQRIVDASADMSGIEGSADALKIGRLALGWQAKSGDTSLEGKIDTPVQANLTARLVDLPRLAGQLELTRPGLPVKTLQLQLSGNLKADLAKGSLSGAAEARLDDSHVQARFDVTRFEPLAVGFAVDVDKLNADRYIAAQPAGKDSGTGETSEAGFDFSVLEKLDMHGSVRIGSLQVSQIKASDVKLQINSARGKLEAAPHSANLYGGALKGALTVNAREQSVALRQDLSNISIDPLLRDVMDKDMLEGRGDVSVDVVMKGATAQAMKQTLSGSARMRLRDGAIKGINLARTLRTARASLGGGQDLEQRADQTQKTDFSELSASFRLDKGVAHNQDLLVKSPFLRLTGAGQIDVAAGTIDYVAKTTVVGTSKGQGGKELDELSGVTVPVRLTGPFDNLSYRLEFGQMVTEAAKSKIEEKKQEATRRIEEKVQERLKGLLRR